jgi:hypothetical protein
MEMRRAFQLKIVIKNSKPPIWRRVIVPAGITFSQLSMILNEAMGWSGYHMFEFEFYHLEIRIAEEADAFETTYGPYDYIEASNTYIREYLEQNDWFTYSYDLGDQWQHRVTIEKILTDYEYDYPQVIKYKGDCPMEDCGGIQGYYECLEVIKDKNHPEYSEKKEWMRLQGYPQEYDLEEVNRELKEIYFYKWGKGENRYQNTLYEEIFHGSKGLRATKRDKNKNVSINRSGKHELEDLMRQFQENARSLELLKKKSERCTLHTIFEDFEKEDIVEIAKEKGIKRISKCSKNELIQKLTEYMLQSDVMKACFVCLQDEEIRAFENATMCSGLYETENLEVFMKLYETSYVGMLEDGQIMIPRDVLEVYQSWDKNEFENERKKVNYLKCCLQTAGFFYGIFPITVLQKLLDRNPYVHMSEEEMMAEIKRLPSQLVPYIVVGDKVYHADLYPDDGGLLVAQGNREFYIPTYDEIMAYGTMCFDPDNREFQKMKRFLKRSMKMGDDEAECLCVMIQLQIMGGCQPHDVFEMLEDMGLALSKESRPEQLVECIQQLWNHTRMLLNRGFTPQELSDTTRKKTLMAPYANNVIDFEQARKKKK